MVGDLPNSVHDEVYSRDDEDVDDEVKDKDGVPVDSEPQTEKASQFEVPANENKV